mmetsp:Transcript_699/g.1782  ORF Transcript_699/g.1782 Transcript_699/m.1782 type:complete len:399 (-) Transcript_699:209-1405(-)|eukprot:CAMPEP_0174941550 /NCGR_PEP_ID=MMETSP1355-20121228/72002_1 /TAXON_ID=464990 /ORGANISM="Hemiselmis tepida, Strain CCMP443" /LENGTH=398 /DNA_ID=CAMNT_0016188665 /DNA_START=97 /DNA_END=1294 /DNA_ORIENTATION=+
MTEALTSTLTPADGPASPAKNKRTGSVVKMLKKVGSLTSLSVQPGPSPDKIRRRRGSAIVDAEQAKELYKKVTGGQRRLSMIGFQEIKPENLEFGEKMGEGAMGVVHAGTHNGVPVAIKSFKGAAGEAVIDRNSDFGRDLISELDLLFSVGHHPNLVGFYGAVTLSKPMLVLELVRGPTLDEVLHGKDGSVGKIDFNPHLNTVYGWSRDLLSGVAFMHDRDPCIIHRDLKPANLILTAELSTLKILDFGVGKMVSKKDRLTRQMTSCTGTNRYMAPEVYFSDGNYTEKADIYSCALIMWEIATGRRPFDGPGEVWNLNQQSTREVMRPIVASITSWPDIGPLIEKAWLQAPEDRPSAKELIALLDATPGAPPPGTDSSPISYLTEEFLTAPQCQCCVM